MIWILPVISAFIFDLPFESSHFGLLAFFGLFPLFLFLEKIKNRKQAFLGGWLFGSLFFIFVLRWLLYSYPLDWAGINNSFLAIAVLTFVWLGGSIFVGISSGFFAYFIFPFFRREIRVLEFLAIPAGFVIMEFLRALLFGLFIWAPGMQLGVHWSFGDIGYALIDTPAIYWSRVVGIYGLGFFIALGNLILFRILRSQDRFRIKYSVSLVCLILILFSPLKFPLSENGEKSEAVLVHGKNKEGILSVGEFNLLWKEVANDKNFKQPDLVVLPEAEELFTFSNGEERQLMTKIFPDINKPGLIITGSYHGEPGNFREQNIFLNQRGEMLAGQDKSFLMPLGEYLPIVLKTIIGIFNPAVVKNFDDLRSLSPALNWETPVMSGNNNVGALLCSGIISPEIYRSLANQGANVFVNSASQIIFKDKSFYLSQMKTLARFQAIANARPLLQANNGGRTFFIDADGKITAETGGSESKLLISNFSPVTGKTIFTRFGNWPVIAFSFLIVLAVLLGGFKKLLK